MVNAIAVLVETHSFRRTKLDQVDVGPTRSGRTTGFVEFSLAQKGLYPIVTHKFANVGKGALGLFQAGDVPPTQGAAH